MFVSTVYSCVLSMRFETQPQLVFFYTHFRVRSTEHASGFLELHLDWLFPPVSYGKAPSFALIQDAIGPHSNLAFPLWDVFLWRSEAIFLADANYVVTNADKQAKCFFGGFLYFVRYIVCNRHGDVSLSRRCDLTDRWNVARFVFLFASSVWFYPR